MGFMGRVIPKDEPTSTALDLEVFLGAPECADSRVTFEQCLRDDAEQRYPNGAVRDLQNHALTTQFLAGFPSGTLLSVPDLGDGLRSVARRDLTMAVSYANTLLASLPIAIAGSDEQRSTRVDRIRGNARFGFALTERDHGSDLGATATIATPVTDGYSLTGEKWLINHVSRGDGLTVLARTSERPGDLSLFLFDKDMTDPAGWKILPRIHTLGLRGADIGGVRFDALHLANECLVGRKGRGLETTLKTLQVSRTLCGDLSLGAADTVLRCVVDFAGRRRLYGERLWDLPWAQESICSTFADLLIADCVVHVARRSLHIEPKVGHLAACVCKSLVPPMACAAIESLAEVMGARHYLVDEQADYPMVPKMLRDARVIPVFDGSTAVNLHALFGLLAPMRQRYARQQIPPIPEVFRVQAGVPAVGLSQLKITTSTADPVTLSLPAMRDLLSDDRRLDSSGGLRSSLVDVVAQLVTSLDDLFEAVDQVVHESESRARDDVRAFSLGESYALHFAAASCLGTWLFSATEDLPSPFQEADWLLAALQRIQQMLQPQPLGRRESHFRCPLGSAIRHIYESGHLFSATFPATQISEPGTAFHDGNEPRASSG